MIALLLAVTLGPPIGSFIGALVAFAVIERRERRRDKGRMTTRVSFPDTPARHGRVLTDDEVRHIEKGAP